MIEIVTANEAHLDQLVPLFEGYRTWYKQDPNPDGSRAFLKERMQKNESVIYLAVDRDTGVGVGFTQLYPLFSSTRIGRVWLLNDLFVSAAYRGRGISVSLIEKAQDLVRSTGAVGLSLETDKTNDIGNKLYPRTGFTLNVEQNFYFWQAN